MSKAITSMPRGNKLPLALMCLECADSDTQHLLMIPADAISWEGIAAYLTAHGWTLSAVSRDGKSKPEFWTPVCDECVVRLFGAPLATLRANAAATEGDDDGDDGDGDDFDFDDDDDVN